MAKKTRGKAAPDRQLKDLQRRILMWVYDKEESTRLEWWERELKVTPKLYKLLKNIEEGTVNELMVEGLRDVGLEVDDAKVSIARRIKRIEGAIELTQKGVRWSTKLFFDASPTASQRATLSGALGYLDRRGLIVRYDSAKGLGGKPRTTHVKLTNLGRKTAFFLKDNGGKSQRQVETEQRRKTLFLRARVRYTKENLRFEEESLRRVDLEIMQRENTRLQVPPKLYTEQAELKEKIDECERLLEQIEEQLTEPDWEEHEARLRNFITASLTN